MADSYQTLQKQLQDLQRRLQRGELDERELRRLMHEASIEDPERPGSWWNLDPDTGGWVYSDGGPWREVASDNAPARSADIAASTLPSKPAGSHSHSGRAVVVFVVLLVIVAVAAWLVIRYRGIPFARPFGEQTVTINQQPSATRGGDSTASNDASEEEWTGFGHRYTIASGAAVDAETTSIPASGGSLEVGSGNPISGFSIQVPAGSYDETVSFRVSSAPITGVSGPIQLVPATPLIHVDNGGGYSRHHMRVRIPVAPSAVADTLPFLYDPETGRLEGLPLLGRYEDAIETRTRHFSYLIGLQITLAIQQMFVVTTDFTVGVDTWPFANNGTYWEPEGICAGMSLSALWYRLYGRQPGAPSLWRVLDPGQPFATPDFGWDDIRSLHFTSEIQGGNDDAASEAITGMEGERGKDLTGEAKDKKQREYYAWTWKTIIGDMVMTGKPQDVAVEDEKGELHAMVAYAASIPDRRLFVYDPNLPRAAARAIQFTDKGIEPFYSSTNAKLAEDEGEVPFVHFYHLFSERTVDPDVLSSTWSASATKRLQGPGYELVILDQKGEVVGPLGANHSTTDKVLRVRLDEGATSVGMDLQLFRARPSASAPSSREVESLALDRTAVGTSGIPLYEGQNEIGFMILATNPEYTIAGLAWRDFRWVTVQQGILRLEPSPLRCKPGVPCRLEAILTAPVEQPNFLWSVDGGSAESSGDRTFREFTFDAPGEHTIQVELRNLLQHSLGTAQAPVIVSGLSMTLSPNPLYAAAGSDCIFHTTLGDLAPTTFTWYVDGALAQRVGTGPQATIKFNRPGRFTVEVAASTNDGVVKAQSQAVIGGLELRVTSAQVVVGEEVGFVAEPTNPPPKLRYTWHLPGRGPTRGSASAVTSFDKPGTVTIRVEAVDEKTGVLWAEDQIRVTVAPKEEPPPKDGAGSVGYFDFGEGRFQRKYVYSGGGAAPSSSSRPSFFWKGSDWKLSSETYFGVQPIKLSFTALADGAVTFRTARRKPEEIFSFVGGGHSTGSYITNFPFVSAELCHWVDNRGPEVAYNRIDDALRTRGGRSKYHASGGKSKTVQLNVWGEESDWITVSKGDTIVLDVSPYTVGGNGAETENDSIYIREWICPPQSGEIQFVVKYVD